MTQDQSSDFSRRLEDLRVTRQNATDIGEYLGFAAMSLIYIARSQNAHVKYAFPDTLCSTAPDGFWELMLSTVLFGWLRWGSDVDDSESSCVHHMIGLGIRAIYAMHRSRCCYGG